MIENMLEPNHLNCGSSHVPSECQSRMLPVHDALDLLSGKWKLPIIICLTFGAKRFKQISADIPNITDKMLSKELKSLEENQLVKRTVIDSFPVRVEYNLTEYAKTLNKLIDELHSWGSQHRERIKAM